MATTQHISESIRRNTTPQNVSRASITGISIGLLSSKEIRDQSVMEVTSLSANPEENGLHSALLGTVNKYTPCGTCNQFVDKCQMHWGYISLPQPLIYPGARSKIAKLLKAFCPKCIKPNGSMSLYYSDEEIAKYANVAPDKRLNVIDAKGKRECILGSCVEYNAPTAGIGITVTEKKKTAPIPMLSLISLLDRMDKEDLVKLGVMIYPASLYVFDTIPVPPIQVRAPDSLTGKESKLTLALKNILQLVIRMKNDSKNERLEKKPDDKKDQKPAVTIEDIYNAYKLYLTTKVDTKLKDSVDIIIGLKYLMDGKEGHMRGVVNGKRTNFCGRSVVSPDPNLTMEQIGIPKEIADKLTTTVTIYRLNINLYNAVLTGQRNGNNTQYVIQLFSNYKDYLEKKRQLESIIPTNRPEREAKVRNINKLEIENKAMVMIYDYIANGNKAGKIKAITRNGRYIPLVKNALEKITLKDGDIIHRTIIDGDPVTLNRHPTLHKFSFIAGLVKIMSYRTIGVHPSWTSGFNMD